MPLILNEEKLKKLIGKMEEEELTKAEFKKAFNAVINYVKKIETQNKTEMMKIMNRIEKAAKDLKGGNESSTAELTKKIDQLTTKKLGDVDSTLKRALEAVSLRLSQVRDGKDADEEKVSQSVLERVLEPAVEKIVEEMPEGVRDALESLQGDDRLDVSAIKGLKDLIKEKMPIGGGGGFNYGAVDMHFVDDETPSGTVNGTNKAFTITNIPSPATSLKVFVNGQKMTLTEDYTFSGTTITFVTAPPTGSILTCDYRV